MEHPFQCVSLSGRLAALHTYKGSRQHADPATVRLGSTLSFHLAETLQRHYSFPDVVFLLISS